MNVEASTSQGTRSGAPNVEQQGQRQARPKRLNFSNPDEREEHIHAFLT